MDGKLVSYSVKNFWGGYNTYNRDGKKISESYKSFWEGFNHFDVEEPDQDEVIVPVKREYKKIKPKEDTVSKQEKTVEKKPEIKNATKDKPIFTHKQNIDKSIEYYESVSAFVDVAQKEDDFVKILAFLYKDLKEFPALAHKNGEKIVVVPLIKGSQEFEFAKSEVENAQCKTLDGLDMAVVDNEFVSLGVASLAKEFEDLFPEYLYGENGFYRTQYKLACGLVVTEKSWNELKKL